MVNAVVFDMDGVLVDSEPFGCQLDNMFLKQFGHEIDEEFSHKLVGTTMQKSWEMIKEHFEMPHALEELTAEYKRFSLEQWRSLPQLEQNVGVPELLKRLQAANIPVGLATSANRDRMNLFLDRLSLNGVFRAMVCGDDVQHSKPEPDIYLDASRKLHVDATECVAIEDAEAGVASAKATGMKVIGYKVPASKQNLYAADLIVNDFSNITIEALHAL